MSVPLYFFPNRRESDLVGKGELLRREFLAEYANGSSNYDELWHDVTRKGQCIVQEVNSSQSGHAGLLFAPLAADKKVPGGLNATGDDWQSFLPDQNGNGRLWIRARNVTPLDLARPAAVDGYPLQLANNDQANLIVPIIRTPEPTHQALPERIWLGDDEQVVRTLYPRDAALFEALGPAWDHLTNKESSAAFSLASALALALRVVGRNYRYGNHEQRLLGWLDTNNWEQVLRLACDLPVLFQLGMLVAQKKTTATEESGTSSLPEHSEPVATSG